ncbi:MAG: site-specific integrase [Methanobacteriota archaeon]
MPDTPDRLNNLTAALSPSDLKLVKEFFADRNLLMSSQINYLNTFVPFLKFTKKDLDRIEKADIQAWIENESKRKQQGTINLDKTHLKAFFTWRGGDEKPPAVVSWIKLSSQKQTLPVESLLTEDEIRAMIEAADSSRDKALVSVLYESALRVGEFLSLKVKSIEFDKYGAVVILPRAMGQKTGQRRIRLIDSVPYLQGWINHHPRKSDPEAALWWGGRWMTKKGDKERKGAGLRISQVQALLKKYAERAGVKKRVNPHSFRHARLTKLSQILTEMELRIFAGWSKSSNMPETYIHLSGGDVDKKILASAGLLEPEEEAKAEEKPLAPLKCPRCGEINPADAAYCFKCSMALSLKAAVEAEKRKESTDWLMRELLDDADVKLLLKRKLASIRKKSVSS